MALDILSSIDLDMKAPNAEKVYSNQYDNVGHVRAQLLNDGTKWEVPDGSIGVVSYRKADRIGGYYDTTEFGETAVSVSSDKSIITISLDHQTMSTSGIVHIQVNFYKDEHRLSTFAFLMQVNPSVIVSSNAESKWFVNLLLTSGIVIDDTLSISGSAADSKVAGDNIKALNALINNEATRATNVENQKINKPIDEPYGTAGQLLRTNGDGTTEWVTEGTPTDEQVGTAVEEWLDDHPEATTTVQDNSISDEKLTESLRSFINDLGISSNYSNDNRNTYKRILHASRVASLVNVGGQVAFADDLYIYCFGDDNGEATVDRINKSTFEKHDKINLQITGHPNGAWYDGNDYFYVVTPENIYKFNINNFELVDTFNAPENINLIAGTIDLQTHDTYILAYSTIAGTYNIFSFTNESFILLFALNKPGKTSIYTRSVIQNMFLYNNVFAVVLNCPNSLILYDKTTGQFQTVVEFEEGDGFYPYGEIEALFVSDNDIYLLSALYTGGAIGTTQFWKTRINTKLLSNGEDGQSIVNRGFMYVDNTKPYATNPDGTSERPFYNLLEAASVYMYQAKFLYKCFSEIFISGDYNSETFVLNNCNASISSDRNALNADFNITDCNIILHNINAKQVIIRSSHGTIRQSTIVGLQANRSNLEISDSYIQSIPSLESNIKLKNVTYEGFTSGSDSVISHYSFKVNTTANPRADIPIHAAAYNMLFSKVPLRARIHLRAQILDTIRIDNNPFYDIAEGYADFSADEINDLSNNTYSKVFTLTYYYDNSIFVSVYRIYLLTSGTIGIRFLSTNLVSGSSALTPSLIFQDIEFDFTASYAS